MEKCNCIKEGIQIGGLLYEVDIALTIEELAPKIDRDVFNPEGRLKNSRSLPLEEAILLNNQKAILDRELDQIVSPVSNEIFTLGAKLFMMAYVLHKHINKCTSKINQLPSTPEKKRKRIQSFKTQKEKESLEHQRSITGYLFHKILQDIFQKCPQEIANTNDQTMLTSFQELAAQFQPE